MSIYSNFPVLIVEDNPDDRIAITRELNKIEPRMLLEFEETASGALISLKEKKTAGQVALPKVIILDLNLPGMSGIEMLRTLRAEPILAHIPVIVLTGSDDPKHLISAFQDNVSSYVLKPAKLEDLREVLRIIASFLQICEFV